MAKSLEAGGLRPEEGASGLAPAEPVTLPRGLGVAPDGVRSVPFEAAGHGGAHRGTTAVASISNRNSGFASPATKAAVIAGGFGVATHACWKAENPSCRDTPSTRSKVHLITCSGPAPPAASAARTLARTCSVWAATSPLPTMLPEASTAFCPPTCTVLTGPSTTTTLEKAGFLCSPSGLTYRTEPSLSFSPLLSVMTSPFCVS